MVEEMKYFKLHPVRNKLNEVISSLQDRSSTMLDRKCQMGINISNGVKIIGLVWVVIGFMLPYPNFVFARRVKSSIPTPHRITPVITTENRHIKVDEFILNNPYIDIKEGKHVIVDLGVGLPPITTLELAEKMHAVNKEVRIIGIDNRFDIEEKYGSNYGNLYGNVSFYEAGFDFPIYNVSIIRCFNVLAYYNDNEQEQAIQIMGERLKEDGILIIGNNSVRPCAYAPDADTSHLGHLSIVYQESNGQLIPREVEFSLERSPAYYPLPFGIEYLNLEELFEDYRLAMQVITGGARIPLDKIQLDFNPELRDGLLTQLKRMGYNAEYKSYTIYSPYYGYDVEQYHMVVYYNAEGELKN
jgi:SAM-dependent methyltransferase